MYYIHRLWSLLNPSRGQNVKRGSRHPEFDRLLNDFCSNLDAHCAPSWGPRRSPRALNTHPKKSRTRSQDAPGVHIATKSPGKSKNCPTSSRTTSKLILFWAFLEDQHQSRQGIPHLFFAPYVIKALKNCPNPLWSFPPPFRSFSNKSLNRELLEIPVELPNDFLQCSPPSLCSVSKEGLNKELLES